MRIDPKNIGAVYESQMKNHAAAHSEAKEDAKSAAAGDRLELSKEYKNRSAMENLKRSTASDIEKDTDPEKLNRLKSAVDSGNYRVDSATLADAILGNIGRK